MLFLEYFGPITAHRVGSEAAAASQGTTLIVPNDYNLQFAALTCRDGMFNGKAAAFPIAKLRVLRPTGELCMSRSRVSISNCPDRKTIAPSLRGCAGSPKRYGLSAALAPPVCFISALALTLVIGSVGAAADPGGCTSTVPGVDLTCTGTVVIPLHSRRRTVLPSASWAIPMPLISQRRTAALHFRSMARTTAAPLPWGRVQRLAQKTAAARATA